MSKPETLRQRLDEELGGLHPNPRAVEGIVARAERKLRRRRAATMVGLLALASAAAAIPIVFHDPTAGGNDASPAMHSHHVSNAMRPEMPPHPKLSNVPSIVSAAQQAAQSSFVQFLGSIGASLRTAQSSPDLTTSEFSVGGDVTLGDQSGAVYIRIYQQSSSIVSGDFCAHLRSSGVVVQTCTSQKEDDGSTMWLYSLPPNATSAGYALTAVNVRQNGQAVAAQATNYDAESTEPVTQEATGSVVLSGAQLEALASLPSLAFPGRP